MNKNESIRKRHGKTEKLLSPAIATIDKVEICGEFETGVVDVVLKLVDLFSNSTKIAAHWSDGN